VSYTAQSDGQRLRLQVGFSHPVVVPIPKGLKVETPAPTMVVVTGPDKQMVGEFAARVRRVRPPEPYKGKGIRYAGEQIVQKAGKSFVGGEK
jgi:large subunit ribosomal protein L6